MAVDLGPLHCTACDDHGLVSGRDSLCTLWPDLLTA